MLIFDLLAQIIELAQYRVITAYAKGKWDTQSLDFWIVVDRLSEARNYVHKQNVFSSSLDTQATIACTCVWKKRLLC